MQGCLLYIFRPSSSVLYNNARVIIPDHLILFYHMWTVVQRGVEHAHVGLYIHQLIYRHDTESVVQFCVNKTHCREVTRPAGSFQLQMRISFSFLSAKDLRMSLLIMKTLSSFTLLYLGGTNARLVYTWYKNLFRMIAVLIVFLAANRKIEIWWK